MDLIEKLILAVRCQPTLYSRDHDVISKDHEFENLIWIFSRVCRSDAKVCVSLWTSIRLCRTSIPPEKNRVSIDAPVATISCNLVGYWSWLNLMSNQCCSFSHIQKIMLYNFPPPQKKIKSNTVFTIISKIETLTSWGYVTSLGCAFCPFPGWAEYSLNQVQQSKWMIEWSDSFE